MKQNKISLLFLLTVLSCSNANDLIPVNFGGFKQVITENDLGRGFKVNDRDTLSTSPFKGQVIDGDVEIGPMTGSSTINNVITDYSRFEETMEISGSLALDLVLIRAEGSGRYLEKYVSTTRKVTFVYRTTHTAFYKRLQPGTLIVGKDAIDVTDQDELVEKFGHRFVDTVVYGASLDMAFTVTATEDINIKEFEAMLKVSIGIGLLSVTFMKKFQKREGHERATYEMDINVSYTGVGVLVAPTDPAFSEACDFIDEFNHAYENKVRNFEEDSFEPVGFMLSSTADRINRLDKLQMGVLEDKMNDSAKVLENAMYWRSKLKEVKRDLTYRYDKDARLRKYMFVPYVKNYKEAMKALEGKIKQFKAFRAQRISVLISENTKVPEAYPQIGSPVESILRGLCGEHYIPSPVKIGDRNALDNGLYYIGFSLFQGGKMIPWMHGRLSRSIDGVETVIASTETPESLYDEVTNPTPTSSPTNSCYFPLENDSKCPPGTAITKVEQCKQAGFNIGGNLKNGDVITRQFHDTPCGCYIDLNDDTNIHFDNGSDCKEGEFILICNDNSSECAL